VIRGVVDGRLGEGADLTCAEVLLRIAGMDPTDAAKYVVDARNPGCERTQTTSR